MDGCDMFVAGIYRLFKNVRYYRNKLLQYEDYLLPGQYRIHNCGRIIYHDDDITKEFVSQQFWTSKGSLKRNMAYRTLELIRYFRCKKEGSGRCSVIYFANNYDEEREMKLFDLQLGRVMVVPAKAKSDAEIIEEFPLLNDAFSIQKTEESSAQGTYWVDLIQRIDKRTELEALQEIVNSHVRYLRLFPARIVECDMNGVSKELDRFLQIGDELFARLEKVFGNKLIMSLQHGDLSCDNLFYGLCNGERKYWWIDWEHCSTRLFYYDFFFYIINNAVFNRNLEPTRCYFSGKCDNALERLFETTGNKFLPEYRQEYFLLFIHEFFKERLNDRLDCSAAEEYRKYVKEYLLKAYSP